MKRLQVRIDDDLDFLLRRLAEEEHSSKAELVRRLLRQHGHLAAPEDWETPGADQKQVDHVLYA